MAKLSNIYLPTKRNSEEPSEVIQAEVTNIRTKISKSNTLKKWIGEVTHEGKVIHVWALTRSEYSLQQPEWDVENVSWNVSLRPLTDEFLNI